MELVDKLTQIIFALTSPVSPRELPDPMDKCGLVELEDCQNLFTKIISGRGFVAGKPSSELIWAKAGDNI